MKFADKTVIIPQAPGFVDSFNVSVACAITLYEARTHRERARASHADLDQQQQDILTAAMLLRHRVSQHPFCLSSSSSAHFESQRIVLGSSEAIITSNASKRRCVCILSHKAGRQRLRDKPL